MCHYKSIYFIGAAVLCVSLLGCDAEISEPKLNPELVLGESLYTKNCKVCHAQGINGAPILGNKAMWKNRAIQTLPVLVEHASNGYGLMPAKGGKKDLTEQDIELVVRYMLSELE